MSLSPVSIIRNVDWKKREGLNLIPSKHAGYRWAGFWTRTGLVHGSELGTGPKGPNWGPKLPTTDHISDRFS
jgi:hypothetical protein